MKKRTLVTLTAFFLVLSLTAQAPSQAPTSKPDERVKNLDLVE